MFNPQQHLIKLPRKVKEGDGRYRTVYDEYLEVKWRLVWFRERCPHGVIETQELCVDLERGYARFRAVVEDGEGGKATGYGTETAAGFADYVERAETRALGRALAALGIGTQFVGQDLTAGEHIVDAPVARAASRTGALDAAPAAGEDVSTHALDHAGPGRLPVEARLSQDQARELKKAAQTAYGYREGERRLRQDLGFEGDEALTLRHLAAHVPVARYQALMAAYEVALRQAMEQDVLDHPPPASNGSSDGTPVDGPAPSPSAPVVPTNGTPVPELPAEERLRWGALSRRSMRAGLSPTVWESLRQVGDYRVAETMIAALEGNGAA